MSIFDVRPATAAVVLTILLFVSSCTRSENKPDKAATSQAGALASKTSAGSDSQLVEHSKLIATATDDEVASKPSAATVAAPTNIATSQEPTRETEDVAIEQPRPKPRPKLPPPEGAQRLSPAFDVWIDPKQGVVIIDGEISLREGMLEMFACTRGTKEHESVVSANTQAYLVHAGLLGLGAEPGHPVVFQPDFQPPSGPEIEITVHWRDENGKEQSARAQDMIEDTRTRKAMTYPFVFAGSLFYKDPETGKQFYMAESGDFICVSNFSTAMLDIPVKSSQQNDSLEFVAFTEHIPPLGTPVQMILKPKLKPDEKSAKEDGAKAEEAKAEKKSAKD